MYLDTNSLIAAGDPGSAASLQIDRWLIAGEHLSASAMAWAEYLCGPLRPHEEKLARTLLHTVEPVDEVIAALAASLFNSTGRRSRSMPDCIMAATAILGQRPLATRNLADFQPFVPYGLTLA